MGGKVSYGNARIINKNDHFGPAYMLVACSFAFIRQTKVFDTTSSFQLSDSVYCFQNNCSRREASKQITFPIKFSLFGNCFPNKLQQLGFPNIVVFWF